MKDIELIIKMSEEMYKWVYDVNKFSNDYGMGDFIDLIKNGTPLDDLKKEIDKESVMHMDGEIYVRNIDVKRILGKTETR